MLLTADWVLPVDSPPIRNGAMLVYNGRIAQVGPLEGFATPARTPRAEFPGHVLVPGLVDAHTHLSLTALAGLLRPSDFVSWLGRVVPMIRALDDDDMASSVALGAIRCLESGITVVGDIAYGPEAAATAADLGLGGVFFWEVYGVPAAKLRHALSQAEFPLSAPADLGGRTRCGISPHSAYTSGPDLLRAAAKFSRERGFPLAIHVAESVAEMQLLSEGTGPLAPVAESLIAGFETPRRSTVAYLQQLGVLDGALAVHCVHLSSGDARMLADRTAGVVLCPRSNAFLRNGFPPFDALSQAGATLALGTDSPASNEDIDLFAEARSLREMHRKIAPARLLEMMTLDGARALGMADRFGSFTPGKQADVIAVRIGTVDDPLEALIELGGRDTIDTVMSAGIWRIREGRFATSPPAVENAARRATQRAKDAMPGD